jgi:DNA-directed RNA polymerase subunit RPC12/RpoP
MSDDFLTDSDSTKAGEIVQIDETDPNVCLNCGFKMIELSACHLKCPNCGTEKDCSDVVVW